MYNDNIRFIGVQPQYPPDPSDFELYRFRWFQGISDHLPGIVAPIAAASVAGVSGQKEFYVEKHITLSKQMDCLDNPVSIDFLELENLAKALKTLGRFQVEV